MSPYPELFEFEIPASTVHTGFSVCELFLRLRKLPPIRLRALVCWWAFCNDLAPKDAVDGSDSWMTTVGGTMEPMPPPVVAAAAAVEAMAAVEEATALEEFRDLPELWWRRLVRSEG